MAEKSAAALPGSRYCSCISSERRAGALTNPDWCYNILANPLVSVETGAEEIQARASIAEEPERTRLYDQMVEIMPGFAEYQRRTTRVIPVIILTPVK